jgi:oxygen-independent coproporphyrinogen-3 oxidase
MKYGIYIHIPFCTARCNYCHFVMRPWRASTAERYWQAVLREIQLFCSNRPLAEEVDSVYFGGGTPSVVPEQQLIAIFDCLKKHVTLSPDCEISLEANPGDFTQTKINTYLQMGVNRISVGAQCFHDKELAALGRDHTAAQIEEATALLAKNSLSNINLDLMLGLPEQTGESWRYNLKKISEIRPAHLSIYMLDLDEKTPLYHYLAKKRLQAPEDDLTAGLYLETLDFIAELGYLQYEISNFASAQRECRHNLKYWLRRPVLAFGVGAHSFDWRCRYANISNLNSYLKCTENNLSPVAWNSAVTELQALQESIFLGLRLNRGLDWQEMRAQFDLPELSAYESHFRQFAEEGLLEWNESKIKLTRRGMLLSNEVFQYFV